MRNFKFKKTFSIIGLFATIILLFACTKDSAPPTFGDYPTDIGKIFTYKCATSGCHNTASYKGAADLDLSSLATLFKGSNNGSPVIPFRSDFSSLCYFINTYSDLGPANSPTMPLYNNALSRDEVKTIKDWIDSGAPDINGNIMWSDNPNRKKYYVLNQGCDVVTVFDAATQLPIRYITVGNIPNFPESPHMVKVSPDGQYWYVVFVANNILQKYRTSDDSFVGQVTLGVSLDWNTITISNDGTKGYCMAWPNGSVAVVNLHQMSVLHYYNNAFPNGHGTALNATNDTLYVTAQFGNFIYKTDTSVGNPPLTVIVDVPGTLQNFTPNTLDPHEITFSPDGSKYFVTCQASNQVRVMRTAGDSLLQIINTGQYPLEFAKSVSKNKLYVTCQNEPGLNSNSKGCINVIDMTTYQSTKYMVGYEPHGIALDETNGFVIVASRNTGVTGPVPHHSGICGRNGFVNYFNINTMQLLSKKTEVASDPYSVTFRP
jgi:DNA-binding beta-propeller fold protein YncE